MATHDSRRVTKTLLSEPHIEGRRISVLDIYVKVEERGDSPRDVAATFDLDIASVYDALAYYHDHSEEMQRLRETRKQVYDDVTVDRPAGVSPD